VAELQRDLTLPRLQVLPFAHDVLVSVEAVLLGVEEADQPACFDLAELSLYRDVEFSQPQTQVTPEGVHLLAHRRLVTVETLREQHDLVLPGCDMHPISHWWPSSFGVTLEVRVVGMHANDHGHVGCGPTPVPTSAGRPMPATVTVRFSSSIRRRTR
jgi:hypothetical protein